MQPSVKEAPRKRVALGQGRIETIFEPRFNIASSGNQVTIRQADGGHSTPPPVR
jgi:hypothetical protein